MKIKADKIMKKEYRSVIRTKKRIKQSFLELLDEKKDMGLITVSELTQRADIAKSTFYNHYDDVYSVAEEFENELIDNISKVLDEIDSETIVNYELYINKIIEFLKTNEAVYRKAIGSSNVKFFIEKLKSTLSKKMFKEGAALPFSEVPAKRYVEIRFLTNACVDTMVDYFRGTLDLTLDEVGEVILTFLKKLK